MEDPKVQVEDDNEPAAVEDTPASEGEEPKDDEAVPA